MRIVHRAGEEALAACTVTTALPEATQARPSLEPPLPLDDVADEAEDRALEAIRAFEVLAIVLAAVGIAMIVFAFWLRGGR